MKLYEEFKEYETMWSLEETSHSKKIAKPSPEEYFKNITQSKEEAIKFVKEKLAPQALLKVKNNKYFDISTAYAQTLAKETSGNHVEIGKNLNYNYKAFTKESSKFGLFASNILHYIKTGELYLSVAFTEWLDSNKKKITLTGRTSSWPLWQLDDPDSCEGCGCVVENIVNTSNFFAEPYILQNGHKLCSDCLEEWIKSPKGFVDKFLLLGAYNEVAGDIDDFIEHLKFQQQDIDLMIQEWNKRKKADTLGLDQQAIKKAETNFCESATLLHLSAQASDFI